MGHRWDKLRVNLNWRALLALVLAPGKLQNLPNLFVSILINQCCCCGGGECPAAGTSAGSGPGRAAELRNGFQSHKGSKELGHLAFFQPQDWNYPWLAHSLSSWFFREVVFIKVTLKQIITRLEGKRVQLNKVSNTRSQTAPKCTTWIHTNLVQLCRVQPRSCTGLTLWFTVHCEICLRVLGFFLSSLHIYTTKSQTSWKRSFGRAGSQAASLARRGWGHRLASSLVKPVTC